APISVIDPIRLSGTIATAIAIAPRRSRVAAPTRHRTSPVATPAIRLPAAYSASRSPAYPAFPRADANATVLPSAAPNSAPRATPTTHTGPSTAHGRRASRVPRGRGCGTGAV